MAPNLENLRNLTHEVKWQFYQRVVVCLTKKDFIPNNALLIYGWEESSGLKGCFSARGVEGLERFKENAWSVKFDMFQSKLIDSLWLLSREYIQDCSSH